MAKEFVNVNAKVPVEYNGQIGTVHPDDLAATIANGGRVVSQDEFDQAQLQKQYGDAGHAVEAAGIGALETATLGLGTAAIGGLAGEDTKKHIRNVMAANPTATAVGQVAGVVAPIAADVLTGGAATPEEAAILGATTEGKALLQGTGLLGEGTEGVRALNSAKSLGEAVEAPGAFGQSIRSLGNAVSAPQRAVTEIGDVVESGMGKLIGKDAKSFVGRLAQKTLTGAARQAVEGGIYSAGNTLSEESLQEHPDLTAQKMLSSFESGMKWGGALGAGFGAAGVFGRAAVGRLAPSMAGRSEELFIKAIDHDGIIEKAVKTDKELGSIGAIKRRILDDGVIAPGDNLANVSEKARAQGTKAVNDLADSFAKLDADPQTKWLGSIDPAQLNKAIDKAVPVSKFPSMEPGSRGIIDALKKDIRGLEPELERVESPPLTPKEIKDWANSSEGKKWVQENPDLVAKSGFKEAPIPGQEATFVQRPELIKKISITDASTLSRRIQDKIQDSHDPLVIDQLTKARSAIDEALTKHVLGKIGLRAVEEKEAMGLNTEADVDALIAKVKNSHDEIIGKMRIANQYDLVNQAVDRSILKEGAKGGLLGHGVAAAGLGLASHAVLGHAGIITAGGSLAATLGRKVIQERGATTGTYLLDKLETYAAIGKLKSAAEQQFNKGVDKVLYGKITEKVARHKNIPYDEAKAQVMKALTGSEAHADNISKISGVFSTHAPKVARSLHLAMLKSVIYLGNELPRKHMPTDPLFPNADDHEPSDVEKYKFMRKYNAVMDPISVLDNVADGTVTPDEVDAFRQTHPDLYNEVSSSMIEKSSKKKTKPDFKKIMAMKTFLGQPVLSPDKLMKLQNSYIGSAPPGGPPGMAPMGGGKSHGKISGDLGATTALVGHGEHGKY